MKQLFALRWLVMHIVVVVVAVVFFSLGLWQLSRLDHRRVENTVGERRFTSEPQDLETILSSAGGDLDSLVYRRASVIGRFDPENEVLIRSQVYRGGAGFHIITPLVLADGSAVLVNRGWVPLIVDRVPVVQAPPATGEVEVLGWLEVTKTRGALGPRDPAEGRLVTMNRVDIGRIQRQVSYQLTPIYLSALDEREANLPIPLEPPTFDEEGPHLGYAIQWFGFVLVGLIGYGFLIRRTLAASPNPEPLESDPERGTPRGRA